MDSRTSSLPSASAAGSTRTTAATAASPVQQYLPAILLAFLLSPAVAFANTSTVFSPDVTAGERALEYRTSYVPEDGASPDVFAHRLHYQQAFNDAWRARIIGVQRSVDGRSLEYRYTRLEVQWQYLEDQDAGWDAGLRFEAQVGDESPDRFRIAWTGKVDLDNGWQLRANALVGRQFGTGAASGLQLETRAQVTRKVRPGMSLGLELFSDLNTTAETGSFDEQEHQLGPVLKASAGNKWSLFAGYLAGISDAADDSDWRFMVIREF